jgi:hypothetical protein
MAWNGLKPLATKRLRALLFQYTVAPDSQNFATLGSTDASVAWLGSEKLHPEATNGTLARTTRVTNSLTNMEAPG